jgi:hypothetical protein
MGKRQFVIPTDTEIQSFSSKPEFVIPTDEEALNLFPEKKNPSQKGMVSSGKNPYMDTKKDKDGFWGGLSDTFDLGLQRMAASTIS